MKKNFKKIFALILSLILILTALPFSTLAAEKISSCDENCPYYPTIIIPGLGQSSVCVADENGNFVLDSDGNKISAFPAYIQTDKLIKRVLFPVLSSLITQRDIGLSEALSDAITMCFEINGTGLDAKPSGDVIIERMPYPLSEASEYEINDVHSHIPMNLYGTDLPSDHLYYFHYNSFGNHIDMTAELYEYIDMVKEQTGHDKINLVPISQGGTIASALFEYYPDVMDCLHKVIYIVPALDGSNIVGDIFTDRVKFLNKDYLYNGFLPEMGLLDAQTARMIEILLRIFPDDVLLAALNSAVDTLVTDIMTKCTSMWALCPSGDYEKAAELYLSSPEMAEIKKQTDKYHSAQVNSRNNIKKLQEKGIQVFCVAEYNMNLINVGERWQAENADYIIQLDSTAMGVHSANVGETFAEDYVQQNTVCKDPTHNHISPDRVIDASTGLLPDTTFYFEGQRHDLTQHNDVILKLAMELIANDNIKDVYSDPNFPQFNDGRDVRNLRTLISQAEEAIAGGKTSLTLSSAAEKGKAVLDNNLSTKEDYAEAEKLLSDELIACGAIKKETTLKTDLFEKISLFLYDRFGTKGFSQMPGVCFDKALDKLSELFSGIK